EDGIRDFHVTGVQTCALPISKNVDIVIGGGGQDSGQDKVQADLLRISPQLHALAKQNVPMLMICGLYQLFGKFFRTREDKIIQEIGRASCRERGMNE